MASTAGPNSTSVRQSTRQTRTNPSRVSKTAGRTSLAQQYNPATAFTHSSSLPMMGGGGSFSSASGVPAGGFQPVGPGAGVAGGMPHDVYPGITHFTDTMFAIPRELRRHESLFKEVDGKSWALEERLPVVLGEVGRMIMEPAKNGVRPAEEETAFGKGITPQGELPEVTARRKLCLDVRTILSDLLPTMDEKNHVARNANKELRKQIQRLETAYSYVQNEISEDTRMGNLHHWAYSNKATAKAAGSERPRREAANRDRHNEEATGMRKQRRNQADHDDETRTRKGPGRGRAAEANVDTGVATKRRKVEKTQPAASSAAMERTASTNTNSGRGGAKDTDKRKNRGANAATAATAQRKRTNTVTSTAGSPFVAPSPLISAVGTAGKAASPAPSVTQRPSSSRLQATTQANGRQRPSSSASNRPPKKQSEGKGAHHKDHPGTTDSGLNGTGRPASKSRDTTKREDLSVVTKTEAGQASEALPTPSRARSSKTSTPVVSTFAESGQHPTTQRSRPTRSTEGPAKRSHKKGSSTVSTARQVAAAAAAAEEEDISHHGDDEDEEGEPRYCYCNQVSFGEMVACDNDACPREWFHLMCVGLAKPPLKNETWYCNECKDTGEAAKKTKTRGGR